MSARRQLRRSTARGLASRCGRGRLFPHTPHGNSPQAQCIPVAIEHLPIEREYAVACNAVWRRDERREAAVDLRPFGAVRAWQEMPKRKSVLRTGLRKDDHELLRACVGRRIARVEVVERLLELRRSVFEVRGARAEAGARETHGSGGDERIAAVEVKTDPSERGAQGAGAVGLYLQRIRA